MSEVGTKYLLARVTVPIAECLDEFADRLTQLIPGFTFRPEITGRFEEVPACVAEQNGMEFVLFGVPEDELVDEYEVKFKCETNLPLEVLLAQDTGGFVRRFVGKKPVDERGFLDCSQDLAQLLVECGISGCKPIVPGGQSS